MFEDFFRELAKHRNRLAGSWGKYLYPLNETSYIAIKFISSLHGLIELIHECLRILSENLQNIFNRFHKIHWNDIFTSSY